MVRYVVRALVSLVLVLPALSLPPAAATQVPPWRFRLLATSNQVSFVNGDVKEVQRTCSPGYVAVGGGFQANPDSAFEKMAEYVSGGTYTVVVHAYGNLTVNAWAVCALDDHVGTISTHAVDFARNGDGIAGGTVPCPGGQRALFGGADWNLTSGATRRIDGAAPSADGTGWVVSGWSPTNGDTLHVEAYCISAADLGGAVLVKDSGPFNDAASWERVVSCPQNYRYVSGGAMAGFGTNPIVSDVLSVSTSMPNGVDAWIASGHKGPGVAGPYLALWCLPASQVSVSLTQTPPKLTNNTSATFKHTASDQVGEDISRDCRIDGNGVHPPSCSNGEVTVTNLGHGQHTYRVDVLNASGQSDSVTYTWNIDLLPPEFQVLTSLTLDGDPLQ